MCRDARHGACAFTGSLTVPPRKTSDCDLLQMIKDSFGAVAERQSSGIRYLTYLCVHHDISALIQTDDTKEAKFPVRDFLQTTKFNMSKWETWLPSGNGARCKADCQWAATKSLRRGDRGAVRWLTTSLVACRGHARRKQHRLADAMQASSLRVPSFACSFFSSPAAPSHSSFHSRLTHDQCRTALTGPCSGQVRIDTENYEIATKGFENTYFMACISRRLDNRKVVPFGFK